MCDETTKCKACGFEGTLDDFDVLGACDGNLFCNQCNTEIDSEGNPALLCGKCVNCQDLMIGGDFATIQNKRLVDRAIAQLQQESGDDS